MPNLEEKVIEWAQKEFNKKFDKKDITSLFYSKNGHLYVKLFSLMVENFKSKNQCKDFTSKLELIEEIVKRDQLKSQLDFMKDQIMIEATRIEKKREAATDEEMKRQCISKRKLFLTLLAQVLEKIIEFRVHFSKIHEATLLELKSLLTENSILIKSLISEDIKLDLSSQNHDADISELNNQINSLVKELSSSLYELSSYTPLIAEKINLDSSLIDSVLTQTCSSIDLKENPRPVKETHSDLSLGLSVFNLVDQFENKKLEQEDKLLIKLNKVSSMIQKLLDNNKSS